MSKIRFFRISFSIQRVNYSYSQIYELSCNLENDTLMFWTAYEDEPFCFALSSLQNFVMCPYYS